MDWHVVSVPSSVKELLRKESRDDFSHIQKLGAAIQLYVALPTPYRLELARQYASRSGKKGGYSSVFHTEADLAIMDTGLKLVC